VLINQIKKTLKCDHVTMIVPATNTDSIADELANVGAWLLRNNQSLNVVKSAEMVVSTRWTRDLVLPPCPWSLESRVDTLLLLGVVVDSHLLFHPMLLKPLPKLPSPYTPSRS